MPPYEWRVALTHVPCSPTEGCQPAVLERYVYRDEEAARRGDYGTYDHCEHRGACWGCAWRGPVRDRENDATEDAHDHAFPGWRELPAVDPLPSRDNAPEEGRLRDRAARQVALIYPAGWAERCGPTISWRSEGASRHVPGRGLFGGYDMGRVRPGDPSATADRLMQDPESARPVQASLFEEVGQ